MAAIDRKIMERFLTPPEEKQLFQTVRQYSSIEAQRDYAWMLLLRMTGIRIGVLAGLTVDDARGALAEKRLSVRAEINKGHVAYKIYLNKNSEKALRLLLKVRKAMGHPEQGHAPLVMSREHKGMSIRSFQDRCKHWGDLAGLAGFSPHWFRHTIAMRIMQESTAQDPRGIAMAALGHKHINSTAIYTQPDKATLMRIMQEVG